MNYSWNAILHNAARVISEASGVDVREDELTPPPDPKFGDLAFGCFRLAKLLGKNPAQIAQELAEKIKAGDHSIETATAAGPYVNLSLRASDLVPRVIKDVEALKVKYGRGEEGGKKQLMVEYAQPNTHKEVHVGHLRNLVLGTALVNLLKAGGWDVIAASYHGDIGAHVSRCLWMLVRQGKGKLDIDNGDVEILLNSVTPAQRNSKYLGGLYAGATRLLDEQLELKSEVSEVQRRLESGDPAWFRLWQETRSWSLIELGRLFQELGVIIDRQYLESEVQEPGQRIVDELLRLGVAKESQGAIVVDLEDQKLGVFLVRKSDGTSLYAAKDLALAKLKIKEYPRLERSLMVVDNRQAQYFSQLFATLERMGLKQRLEFVGYEFVTLKTGAMSSREGNIVTLQSFVDEVLAHAKRETEKRHADWNLGKLEHTAWCLAMGGIKFGMLKQDTEKMIIFDMEKALSFDGDTGPYAQYAATRLGSILRKANWNPRSGLKKGDMSKLVEGAEKRLAVTMALFPGVVARAGRDLKPSLIAQWCLDMAGRINEFYRDVPVLDAEEDLRNARLRLVASVQSVLLIALNLLAIPVPDEM